MTGSATSVLPCRILVEFRFKKEKYLAFGCSNKLQTIKYNSLGSNVAGTNSVLEASQKIELDVFQRMPSNILGIIPMTRIELLIAYGEDYLAIFNITKLVQGVFSCSNKLQTIKYNSLGSNVAGTNSVLEASQKIELDVFQRMPSNILGIIPMTRIELLIAYGEDYLAIFNITKLVQGGRLCLGNIIKVPTPIVSVQKISRSQVRIVFSSGLIQEVMCSINEKIQFTPRRATTFSKDFNIKSLIRESDSFVAYCSNGLNEHSISTVNFTPTGPETALLTNFNTILKRYSLVSYRYIKNRYLFVLDSLGVLSIHDCTHNERIFIDDITIRSFEIVDNNEETFVLFGDASGMLHLYSLMLKPLALLFREWTFAVSRSAITTLKFFDAKERSMLVSADEVGHLHCVRIQDVVDFNKTVPKTISSLPSLMPLSIYSARLIKSGTNTITECIMLSKDYRLSTFGITDQGHVINIQAKLEGMKNIRKLITKSHTVFIAWGGKSAHIRAIDNKTQLTAESSTLEADDEIIQCFYIDTNSYVIQTGKAMVLRTHNKVTGDRSRQNSGSGDQFTTFLTEDVIFSHLLAVLPRYPTKSNKTARAMLGVSIETRNGMVGSVFYGGMSNAKNTTTPLSLKQIYKENVQVVDFNSFNDGEVYALLSKGKIIRFDVFYTEDSPHVQLIVTGRWSYSNIFGKVYRLLPCPGSDKADVIITGTKQSCKAVGETEEEVKQRFSQCQSNIRRRHDTEIIAWQVIDACEWGRIVLNPGTKFWDIDVDFGRTCLRINTFTAKTGDIEQQFTYAQFQKPEIINCSTPISFGPTPMMKVLLNNEGKCPLRGATVCLITGDSRGLLTVSALSEGLWNTKTSFCLSGGVACLDAIFHPTFGFTVACGLRNSARIVFFSILNGDLVKGQVRLYQRDQQNTTLADCGLRQTITSINLIPSSVVNYKASFAPLVAVNFTSKLARIYGFTHPKGSSLISDLTVPWIVNSLGYIKDMKQDQRMLCYLHRADKDGNPLFLRLDNSGEMHQTTFGNGSPTNPKSWNGELCDINTQILSLPCTSRAFAAMSGGFDGTVAHHVFCEEKQKPLAAGLDKIHINPVIDTFITVDTLPNRGKQLILLSLDSAGIVVIRKLKLTSSKIVSQTKPIKIYSSVTRPTGINYISTEKKIMIIGEGFELVPMV